jgi:hypothetical protein
MNETLQKRGAIYHSPRWKSYGAITQIAPKCGSRGLGLGDIGMDDDVDEV